MAQITNQTPAAGGDDGYFGQTGAAFDAGQTDLRTGDADDVDQTVFLRFATVAIPKNATVSAATLVLSASASQTGAVTLEIQAVAADNPSAPTTAAAGQALARTTASVTWDVPDTTGGTDYTTPNVATVLQEIVNRSGWASGQALVLLLRTTSAATWVIRDFRSQDFGTAALRPRLNVTYATGHVGELLAHHYHYALAAI